MATTKTLTERKIGIAVTKLYRSGSVRAITRNAVAPLGYVGSDNNPRVPRNYHRRLANEGAAGADTQYRNQVGRVAGNGSRVVCFLIQTVREHGDIYEQRQGRCS